MSSFLKPGDRFLEYELLEVLGEGGMGIVFKAREDRSHDIVAIKVLSPKAAGRPDFVARFEEECKFYPKLKHQNIVRMRRTGVAELPAQGAVRAVEPPPPIPFIVMDLLVGKTLRKILERYHRLDYLNTLHILMQIAVPMIVVHKRGIVHRDLKPENIMVGAQDDEKGHVWIMDFGIATDLHEGLDTRDLPDLGSACYMSPEQVQNMFAAGRSARRVKVDHRSDIYSFGVIAYETCTGQHHFVNQHEPPPFEEILLGHLAADPTPIYKLVPECPDHMEDLWHIIKRCLAIKPADRYLSFEEVNEDLQALARRSVPTTHPLAVRVAEETARAVRRAAFASLPELVEEPEHSAARPGALPRSSLSPGETRAPLAAVDAGAEEAAAFAEVLHRTAPLLTHAPRANPLPFVPASAPFLPPVPLLAPRPGLHGTLPMPRPEVPPPGAWPTASWARAITILPESALLPAPPPRPTVPSQPRFGAPPWPVAEQPPFRLVPRPRRLGRGRRCLSARVRGRRSATPSGSRPCSGSPSR